MFQPFMCNSLGIISPQCILQNIGSLTVSLCSRGFHWYSSKHPFFSHNFNPIRSEIRFCSFNFVFHVNTLLMYAIVMNEWMKEKERDSEEKEERSDNIILSMQRTYETIKWINIWILRVCLLNVHILGTSVHGFIRMQSEKTRRYEMECIWYVFSTVKLVIEKQVKKSYAYAQNAHTHTHTLGVMWMKSTDIIFTHNISNIGWVVNTSYFNIYINRIFTCCMQV